MLIFAGLSQHGAPLDLRERCAVPAHERPHALARLRERFGGAVLLSTCARVELYLDHPDPQAAETAAREWFARRAGEPVAEMAEHLETACGPEAVRRAARVACGLESALEGEDEILGQVRRAWLDAGTAGALTPELDAAFRLAVRTGRQARRTGDPTAWTSLADAAAAHAALALERLPAPRALIAGTGPMGMRAARTLRERLGDNLELELAGRTPERVAAQAAALGASPLTLDGLPAALTRADAAVVALRTSRVLLGGEHIAMRPPGRPLLLVDLSVPRAVDPAAGALQGVTLRNVDGLGVEGGHGRWDTGGRTQVERLVDQALRDFAARVEPTDADATLLALRARADGMRRAQLERTLRRLPSLDAETRWAVDALTRSIVNRLLHDPTMRLKADADGAVAQQVRQLFF